MPGRTSKLLIASALLAAAAAGLLITVWMRASASQDAPVSVAATFLGHLHARRFAEASALTSPNPEVGTTAAELERIADRELCGPPLRVTGTHPAQTNGNRVRRWLSGADRELADIGVEFEGACLLRVSLRHTPAGGWLVYRFHSHAG